MLVIVIDPPETQVPYAGHFASGQDGRLYWVEQEHDYEHEQERRQPG